MAPQDESGFVFMLNWTSIWNSAVCGSHGVVSLNSKEMTSDIKSPVAVPLTCQGTAGDLDNGAVRALQVSQDGGFAHNTDLLCRVLSQNNLPSAETDTHHAWKNESRLQKSCTRTFQILAEFPWQL